MNSVDRLVTYIAAYDPLFPGSVQPASAAEIESLQAALGRSVPGVYVDFLSTMGGGMSWLHPADADFHAATIVQYYIEQSWRPPGYVTIGVALNDPFFDIYLEDSGLPEPRVITMPRGPSADLEALKKAYRHPLAGSLVEYLGKHAFRQLRLAAFTEKARLVLPRSASMARAGFALTGARLQSVWFSNDWVQIFDADDAAVIATQFPNTHLTIEICAASRQRLLEIETALRAGLAPRPSAATRSASRLR